MSVQKNIYTSKKTGKTKIQYYADVWYSSEKRAIKGPMRDTPKLARQDETDIQREIEAGKPKASKKKQSTTVKEVYELWHEATKPPTYANSTWNIYGRFYKDYIKDIFEDQQVSKVTSLHVQKYITILKEKYSPETVNKIINILTGIFAYAVDPLKCITINPVSGTKRCKVTPKNKTVWTDDMISYFLNLPEVKESHYYPMFCLSALLGPRPGEVCGLTENALLTTPTYCIDFDRGYDNWECKTDLKTRQSHRTPPIPKYLYKLIHKTVICKKEMRMSNSEWGQNDFLFVSQKGKPIKPHQYATGFKRLLVAHNKAVEDYELEYGNIPHNSMKLPYITLYGFRTSFATNNMRRHPNAALISSIMGNSPKTLIQFYTQSDTEMQKELINQYIKIEKTIS